jgi:hypothetical protein
METCKICSKELKNLKDLSTHLNFTHKISSKDYYDLYLIKLDEGQCSVCGGVTTYRGLGIGYLKTCSLECKSLDKDYRKKRSDLRKGKKQSTETIKKRIENTNQEKKELNRKKTMLNKYGVDNPTKLYGVKTKISEKLTGIKRFRTDEWQKNIIESKRKNGTLKHSNETKIKLKDKLNEYYQLNLDREKYIPTSTNLNHFCGWYNGLYFRSSLELSFLVQNKDKIFTTCEKNKYKVIYEKDNKQKSYYPDFTDGVFFYEIKPSSLVNFKDNQLKIKRGVEIYGDKFKVITEKECPYIEKIKIFELIESGIVVVKEKTLKKLKNYKY